MKQLTQLAKEITEISPYLSDAPVKDKIEQLLTNYLQELLKDEIVVRIHPNIDDLTMTRNQLRQQLRTLVGIEMK